MMLSFGYDLLLQQGILTVLLFTQSNFIFIQYLYLDIQYIVIYFCSTLIALFSMILLIVKNKIALLLIASAL